jgi:hypothetical protein
MKMSSIPVGQMFVQLPSTIVELQATDKPKVWVKIDNNNSTDQPLSYFVDNDALIGFSIGVVKQFGVWDKWYISDGYYEKCVREGKFIPIEDLREVEEICLSRGLEMPESKYLF